MTLDFTLLDFYDTTKVKLVNSGHLPGAQCRCSECDHLKNIEDHWILKLGTLYDGGLNSRDEIKSKSRYNWQ